MSSLMIQKYARLRHLKAPAGFTIKSSLQDSSSVTNHHELCFPQEAIVKPSQLQCALHCCVPGASEVVMVGAAAGGGDGGGQVAGGRGAAGHRQDGLRHGGPPSGVPGRR